MSSANLIPSAPSREDKQLIYPPLPEENHRESTWSPVQNFRLSKISKLEKEIAKESENYRVALKKYKKALKASHNTVVTLGIVTATLSSGAIASSATGVRIVVAVLSY